MKYEKTQEFLRICEKLFGKLFKYEPRISEKFFAVLLESLRSY